MTKGGGVTKGEDATVVRRKALIATVGTPSGGRCI